MRVLLEYLQLMLQRVLIEGMTKMYSESVEYKITVYHVGEIVRVDIQPKPQPKGNE